MRLRKIVCPYCNGTIRSNLNGRSEIFCEYCGGNIVIDDEVSRSEYTETKDHHYYSHTFHHDRYTNDADVIREKNSVKGLMISLGALLLMGLLPMCCLAISSAGERRQAAIAASQGKISAGAASDFIGEDYRTVKKQLKAAGFTDIDMVELNDAGIAFWNNDEVCAISIGGKKNFKKNDYFDPDETVVVSYH